MVTQIERRQQRRFPMRLALSIEKPEGLIGIHCVTRDVSSDGVYFYADIWDASVINFEFCTVLPGQLTFGSPVMAKCSGEVLRTEREGLGKTGVAAKLECWTVI